MARKAHKNIMDEVLVEETPQQETTFETNDVQENKKEEIQELVTENEIHETSDSDEIVRLTEELDQSRQMYIELTDERDMLKSQLEEMRSEIEKLNAMISEFDIQRCDYEFQITSLKTQMKNLEKVSNPEKIESKVAVKPKQASSEYSAFTKQKPHGIDPAKREGYESWN